MTADWKTPGTVDVTDEEGVRLVCVRGNLHRDLQPAQRDPLEAKIREGGGAERLMIELRDLARLDSWGEELIEDVVELVLQKGGRVAVVVDQHRPHLFAGLMAELRKKGKSVRHGHEDAPARQWLREQAA